jgi:hypothetical protein
MVRTWQNDVTLDRSEVNLLHFRCAEWWDGFLTRCCEPPCVCRIICANQPEALEVAASIVLLHDSPFWVDRRPWRRNSRQAIYIPYSKRKRRTAGEHG